MKTYVSLLRKLAHQKLASLNLRGDVLDLGGSKHSYYHQLIQSPPPSPFDQGGNGWLSITTLNIDKNSEPDILADVEKPLPIADETFDAVLAINLLEHIYNFKVVLGESFRVLKPGGRAIFIVPFLVQVHPSPEDYFRYTESALKKMFIEAGWDKVSVEALGYGVMSARFMLLQNFLPSFLHLFFEKISVWEDKIIAFTAVKLGKKYKPYMYPLGYFISAVKS